MDPQQQYQQQWLWAQQQQQQQQQYYQQQPPPQQPPSSGGDDVRTLWIGDLQFWMDEAYITNCFSQCGENVAVKIIRNKQTMQSEGYGFVEFSTHAGAERTLQAYNGALMPNTEQAFRLNWASRGSGEKRSDDAGEHSIFVGDLAPDVTDYTLLETFRAHYPSVKGANVVMDKLTNRAKGYGFVHFGDESEQLRAMTEMNGVMCSGRAMRIGAAAGKKTVGGGAASYQNTQGTQNDSDPNNTTLFVGNLDSNVTDEHLRQAFSQYGELIHVKIAMGKQCGFVQFSSRNCAEEALSVMNGAQLGGRTVRLSWGHNSSNRRPQADQNQWNNAANYGYPQAQNPYGYAAPQDPNMYYGGYPGYGGYAVPPQAQQPTQHQQ